MKSASYFLFLWGLLGSYSCVSIFLKSVLVACLLLLPRTQVWMRRPGMMGPCFQAFPESCTLSLWVEAAGTEVGRCPGLPQFREGVVGWNVVILAVPQSPDGSRGESWLRVIEEDDQGPDAPGPLLPRCLWVWCSAGRCWQGGLFGVLFHEAK